MSTARPCVLFTSMADRLLSTYTCIWEENYSGNRNGSLTPIQNSECTPVSLSFACSPLTSRALRTQFVCREQHHHSLVEWNVIMYLNVKLPLTLVSNKLNVLFFSTLFQWDKNVTLKCIFEETMPKLSVNFGNHISQDSHKNQYPGTICNFGFTELQYSNISWSDFDSGMPYLSFLIGNTHRSNARSSDSRSGWFVWNQLPLCMEA